MSENKTQTVRPGESRLRAAARKLQSAQARRPISVEPTTALEVLLLERIKELEEAIEKLESRVNWLMVTIVGACLVFVLERVLTG